MTLGDFRDLTAHLDRDAKLVVKDMSTDDVYSIENNHPIPSDADSVVLEIQTGFVCFH